MPKSVLIPIADGCEEIEAITIIDVLRRSGATVTIASCKANTLEVTGCHDITFKADRPIDTCTTNTYQLIVLPGGMPGAENLRDCPHLTSMLLNQKKAGRWYAAICAAPAVILSHHGLLDNVRATCYPSFIDQLDGAMPQPDQLIVADQSNRVITAQGPGCVMAFAFRLIDLLSGQDTHRPIAKQLVADWAL